MSTSFRKISAIGLSLTTALYVSGAVMILPVASAATVEELQAQIAALLAQITALQAQLGSAQTGTTTTFSFTRDLTLGSTGDDVKALQQFLNSKGFAVASTGAGSPGNETTYFGNLTRAALGKYQASVGITPTAGYFGPKTRAYIASLAGGTTGGGGTTTPPPTGTALAVAAASDSPTAKTIGSGTAFNPALKVNLIAGSNDVSITGLTIQKSGFIANTRLNGIDVIDSAGVRHGQVVTSVNADNTISILMTSDPIKVKAGATETILVRFNLNSGDYSGTVAFGIAAASAITSDAGSVTGTFPIAGATMNVVNGGSALASTSIAILTSTGSSTLNVDPASAQEITKYRLQELSSQEGFYLHSWTLYNYGNAADTDYKDVELIAQDGTVLATAQPKGQYVTFQLATPYFVDKGLLKTFTVKAKIVGGTTKTIKLVTYNNYDLDLRGATTGVSVLPAPEAGSADTTFPIGNAYNQTTIGSGTITLQRASDSPSSATTPGATNVVLAKFIAKPSGENYELRQVSFYIASSTTSGNHALTGTVYVKVNGVTVFSVGASSIDNDAATTVDLSSYPILTSGQDNTITIEASISTTATAIDSYQVKSFDLTSAKRLVSNDLLSANDTGLNVSTVDGLAISVSAAKLVITTLATPVANSVVVGTTNYEFATIQLNAQTGGEDVKVSSIKVTNSLGGSAARADVSNLLMYKDNETSALSTTASTATNGATVTFTFSTPITVPKATPVILHLKATVAADTDGAGAGTEKFHVASSTTTTSATGASTGNTLTDTTDITYAGIGQAMTIVSSGNIVLSIVSGANASPSANQVINVATTNAALFAFKLTSQFETQKITSLTIRASSTSGTTLATTTIENIKLYEGSNTTPFASAPHFTACGQVYLNGQSESTSTQCTVTFTASDNLLSAPVPTTGVTITVKANIAPAGTAMLGNNFWFLIASTTADYAIKGSVSGTEKTTATSTNKTGTPAVTGITRVVPQNVKIEAVSPTTAGNVGTAAGVVVGVFKVTNNGTAPVLLSTSTLSFANGGSATTTVLSSMSTFKIYASAQGGGQSDTSSWNSGNGHFAVPGTTGASSTVSFATSSITATEQRIEGGSWRYLTIKTTVASANNDTYQFSVSSLGNILFNVAESDLGYSGNGDSDLTDTIYDLYVDGIPSLSTVTAKT